MQQYRSAVITLALFQAKKLVKANIRAKGQRISDYSAKEIALLAEDYLAQHRDELIAEAKHTIATSPYFERWRLSPEVFVKSTKTERCATANSAIKGQIAND